MGRKPRRKIFATEGLKACERELTKPLDCMVLPLRDFTFLNNTQAPRGGVFPT